MACHDRRLRLPTEVVAQRRVGGQCVVRRTVTHHILVSCRTVQLRSSFLLFLLYPLVMVKVHTCCLKMTRRQVDYVLDKWSDVLRRRQVTADASDVIQTTPFAAFAQGSASWQFVNGQILLDGGRATLILGNYRVDQETLAHDVFLVLAYVGVHGHCI